MMHGKAKLYGIPGSHNAANGEAMLRHKGIPYERRDLITGAHALILPRLLGFDGDTVPALKIDGRKVLGSRAIARALDELKPDPPLFPADPQERRRVEDADRWGEDVLQQFPRRLLYALVAREPASAKTFLDGARLGFPNALAAPSAGAIAKLKSRGTSEGQIRADLAALPAAVAEVDRLIETGVLGGESRNAADFQIAAQVRILMTVDDLRATIDPHPAAALARAVYPNLPGHVGAVLSASERALLR